MRRLAKVELKGLEKAIYDLHSCKPKWVESVPVKEVFDGQLVWDGVVEVFDLQDHPTAKRVYAWSHAIKNSKKRRFYAVLNVPPVDSPEKAVRASIVQDFKTDKIKS